MTPEERQYRKTEKQRREILKRISQTRVKASKLALLSLTCFQSAEVLKDSSSECEIELKALAAHRNRLNDFFNTGAMSTHSYHPDRGSNWCAFGPWSISAPDKSGLITMIVRFDWQRIAKAQQNTIEPDPTPLEALAF